MRKILAIIFAVIFSGFYISAFIRAITTHPAPDLTLDAVYDLTALVALGFLGVFITQANGDD